MSRLIAVLLITIAALAACAQPMRLAAAEPMHYQIIVQFRIPVDHPDDMDFVRRLSQDAGVTLVYQRTLATGAHLYRVQSVVSRAEFDGVLHRLMLRHDILYAEEDRRVHPAGKP